MRNIKYGFILLTENTINFVCIDKKSKEMKIYLISDLNDPFCPLPENILFIDYSQWNSPQFIESFTDKIINYIQEKNERYYNQQNLTGSCFSSGIYAGIDVFKSMKSLGFNHLHIFIANKNNPGIGYFQETDYMKKYSSENEIKLFLPDTNISNKLTEILLQNNISLNIFCCGYSINNSLDIQINLPTYFEVCTKTGGRGFYYNVSNKPEKFSEDIKINYQKLHYDFNSIINKRYYYDVQVTLKNSNEFSTTDTLLGICNIKNNIINLSSVGSDFNILYNFKYSKTLKEDKKYSLQFQISYIDPHDNFSRKIRVINYSQFTNENYFKIYTNMDVDAMIKLIICKEISDSLTEKNKNVCCFEKVKENLKKRLVDSLYFYKKHVNFF